MSQLSKVSSNALKRLYSHHCLQSHSDVCVCVCVSFCLCLTHACRCVLIRHCVYVCFVLFPMCVHGWYIAWILPYCGVLCLCRTGNHYHSSEAVIEIMWWGVQVPFFRGRTNVNGPNTLRDFLLICESLSIAFL